MQNQTIARLSAAALAALMLVPVASAHGTDPHIVSATYLNWVPEVELEATPAPSDPAYTGTGILDPADEDNICQAALLGLRPTGLTHGLNYDGQLRIATNVDLGTVNTGVPDVVVDISAACNAIQTGLELLQDTWNATAPLNLILTFEGFDDFSASAAAVAATPWDVTIASQFSLFASLGPGTADWTVDPLTGFLWETAECPDVAGDADVTFVTTELLPSILTLPAINLFSDSASCTSAPSATHDLSAEATADVNSVSTGFNLQNVADNWAGGHGYLFSCLSADLVETTSGGLTISHAGNAAHDWFRVLDSADLVGGVTSAGTISHLLNAPVGGEIDVYRGSYSFAPDNGPAC